MDMSRVIKEKPYEKIVYILHRHWLDFVSVIMLFIAMLAVPFGLYLLLNSLYPALMSDPILFPIGVLIGSVYYLSAYLFFYVRFIDYYLDMWIVTNDRILDIEQHGLFNRVTTELDLYRIQDVTAHIKGVLGTLLRYGDIIISTASTNTSIIFRSIKNPDQLREHLIQLADEDRKYHYHHHQEKMENS